MYNFFVKPQTEKNGVYYIDGKDYNHAKNVLRLKVGEEILLSDGQSSDLCTIAEYTNESVVCKVVEKGYLSTNLQVELYLFQGLPKQDKMELIVQKGVELGVNKIIPVEMARSIVKLDGKKKIERVERWQTIAESAGKQSKRSLIPTVCPLVNFKQAVEISKDLDLVILPYENQDGMQATKTALSKIKKGMKIGIFIGPEGGFSDDEILLARESGAISISLGKRILRTETAAITTLAMCMLYAELNL